MADSEHISARVSNDSQLWEAFEAFREREGYESKSEAVRAAVRRGVQSEPEPVGIVAPMVYALREDARENVTTGVTLAALATMLQILTTSFGPAWSSGVTTAVLGTLLVVSALAITGSAIGATLGLMDRAGIYDPVSKAQGARDGERA